MEVGIEPSFWIGNWHPFKNEDFAILFELIYATIYNRIVYPIDGLTEELNRLTTQMEILILILRVNLVLTGFLIAILLIILLAITMRR